jgi:hypothetical protein
MVCRFGVFVWLGFSCVLHGQGFWESWFNRSDQAKADQPHWMTPLVTVTPRLEQEFRTDYLVQQTAGGDLVNLGNGKGLEFIPQDHVQLLVTIPPYIHHDNPNRHDGFGDVTFFGKYRIIAKNETSGNYIVTAFLSGSVPTGSYTNGAKSGLITPTIAAGKGWGNFDVQGTFGTVLPTSNTGSIGRALVLNGTIQYKKGRLWPEIETNSVFFHGGTNDGIKQVFLTPGLVAGRFRVRGRVLLSVGAGFQIAMTHYHSYNHAAVFSVRFPF